MGYYSVGILIIGSLFWQEKEHRESWRRARLNLERKIPVRAPIRYGRKSCSHGNTYTMVFSNELSTERYGWALVVPCLNSATSADELVIEGKALWAAEQSDEKKPGPLSDIWGAVGLLTKSGCPQIDAIEKDWSQYIKDKKEDRYKKFPSKKGEEAAVNSDGILTIPWPCMESGDPVEDVDFLLATATVPTLNSDRSYASPGAIALAWKKAPKEQRYFDENRRAGITTADDYAIMQHLD